MYLDIPFVLKESEQKLYLLNTAVGGQTLKHKRDLVVQKYFSNFFFSLKKLYSNLFIIQKR